MKSAKISSGFLFTQEKPSIREKYINLNHMDFSKLYIAYYPKLMRFAKEYVVVEEDAENITQDVFLALWEKQDTLYPIENMNAYLFRLVRNKCLDHLRHKISSEKHNKTIQSSFETELTLKLQSLDMISDFIMEKNMETIVSEAIESLPPKCREIFLSNRIEGLKYKEIAERFGISPNTVENQMSIALKKLRVKLKNHISP